MPRYEGTTRESHRHHHRKMKSGAKGKGHDAKRRRAKQDISKSRAGRLGHPETQ